MIGIIKNTNAGFFSCFRTTVSTIKWCEGKDITPYVFWDTSLYNEPEYGENAWEYYFEQTSNPSLGDLAAGKELEKKYMNRVPEAKTAYCEMIEKYIKIKPNISDIVDRFYEENFKSNNVLGVHIRRTDKATFGVEIQAGGDPVSLDKYVEHINKYIKDNKSKLFIATDCNEALDRMKSEFGDLVCYRDTIRSDNGEPVHHKMKNESAYKKGEDVLVDVLLLSKANFLIKGSSSAAVAALLFNKNLKHENLNYIYKKDDREVWAT